MKRRKEKDDLVYGKTPQNESSYRIQDTKNLLNRVSQIKSQQKEESLKARKLDKTPAGQSKLHRISNRKENLTDPLGKHHDIEKNSNLRTNVYSIKSSAKIKTKTFKKPNISRKREKDTSARYHLSNNSDLDEDDVLYPIGEPIIKNLAGEKACNNIGYTTIVYKEPETTLSGHILSGVNIQPSHNKMKEKIITSHQATNTQMIVVNDTKSVDISGSTEESDKNAEQSDQRISINTVEKFSWDKLSESIKLFSTSQKDDTVEREAPKQERYVSEEVQISKTPVSIKSKPSKASLSDTSAHEDYSMDFDDDNEVEVISPKSHPISDKVNTKTEEIRDKENEIKYQDHEQDINEDLLVNQLHRSPSDNELENQENNIVNQLFNRLHLSQDSACSTISDRLSTIPEDPRSHEEREQKTIIDNLSLKSTSIPTLKNADEKRCEKPNSLCDESKRIVLHKTSSPDDANSQPNQSLESYASDYHLREELTSKTDEERSQHDDKILEQNAHHSVGGTKDSSDIIQTEIRDGTSKTGSRKSSVEQCESDRISISKINHDVSNEKKQDHKAENSKHSSLSNVQFSSTSLSTASSTKQSTDSTSDSTKESFTLDKSISKNDATSYQFSEISNISEGQLINVPLLSEGELSATLKSNEEFLQCDQSNEYLADDSENCSDQNKLFVLKKSKHLTNDIATSDMYFSNKKRHELKSKEKNTTPNNSSSSGESSNSSDKQDAIFDPSKDKGIEDDIKLSEGELSASSLQ